MAIGIIFASFFHQFFNFTLIEFSLIVICAFIMDFDIFFSKYAENNNHRMLISHSVIPSIFILIIGLILSWSALIIGGIVYIIHVIIDTFDWGTNLFYFPKKSFGLKILLSKEEERNIEKYMAEYKKPQSFFDFKYYSNKIFIIVEIILFVLMMLFVILYAFKYILLIILYFLGLAFHLSTHLHLKKIESN